MANVFSINSVEVKVSPSWSIGDRYNARSILSCTVVDMGLLTEINEGNSVTLTHDGTTIFSGLVFSKDSYEMSHVLYRKLKCIDNNLIADKRIAAKIYTDELAGDIVKDFISTYLADEGITEGTIDDGPTISKAKFDHWPISEALDRLKTLTGYIWNINSDKELNFFVRDKNKTSWDLTSDVQHENFHQMSTMQKYRNKQYIKGGRGSTSRTKEPCTPKPDGVSRTFIVRYPVATEPTIYVDDSAVSASDVGILGLETGKKWYWEQDNKEIVHDDNETVLADGKTLTMSYDGYRKIRMVGDSPEQIVARKEIETGTSGIYERVAHDSAVTTRAEAIELLEGLITTYAEIADKITFDTQVSGLEAGQILPIDKDLYDIRGDFLIESIEISSPGSNDINYSVVALDGAALGGWENLFKGIIRGQKRFTIDSDEVLVLLTIQTETLKLSGQVDILMLDTLYPALDLYPAVTLYPGTITGSEVYYD